MRGGVGNGTSKLLSACPRSCVSVSVRDFCMSALFLDFDCLFACLLSVLLAPYVSTRVLCFSACVCVCTANSQSYIRSSMLTGELQL